MSMWTKKFTEIWDAYNGVQSILPISMSNELTTSYSSVVREVTEFAGSVMWMAESDNVALTLRPEYIYFNDQSGPQYTADGTQYSPCGFQIYRDIVEKHLWLATIHVPTTLEEKCIREDWRKYELPE